MSNRTHVAKPEHEVLYQELCALVNRHAKQLTPLEILAVAGNMVGKLLALQAREQPRQPWRWRLSAGTLKPGTDR